MSFASKLKAKGFKLDMSDDEYHGGPGISSSQIKQIMRSPRHMIDAPSYDSPTLSFGRLCHTAVLEPHLLADEVVLGSCSAVKSDGSPCTNAASVVDVDGNQLCGVHGRNKELVEIKPVKQSDMDAALAMSEAVRDHCKGILPPFEDGIAEASGFYETGDVLLKIRPDMMWMNDDGSVTVADLKSTQDARPVPFQRSATKYGYGISAAFYCMVLEAIGFEVDRFIWIAAEKSAPYGVALYEASDITLIDGQDRCRSAIDDWKLVKDLEPEDMGVYSREIIPLEIVDNW